MTSPEDGFIVSNEFATVRVRKSTDCNGEQLEVIDLRNGDSVLLDPLELESLARSAVDQRTRMIVSAIRAIQLDPDDLDPPPREDACSR